MPPANPIDPANPTKHRCEACSACVGNCLGCDSCRCFCLQCHVAWGSSPDCAHSYVPPPDAEPAGPTEHELFLQAMEDFGAIFY